RFVAAYTVRRLRLPCSSYPVVSTADQRPSARWKTEPSPRPRLLVIASPPVLGGQVRSISRFSLEVRGGQLNQRTFRDPPGGAKFDEGELALVHQSVDARSAHTQEGGRFGNRQEPVRDQGLAET